MGWFRHAFAVDEPGAAEPTEQQKEVVDWVCRQVARRHLTTPGLIMLEMSRPLNWVGAQAMHFLRPAVHALVREKSYASYVEFIKFLEHRGAMEYMARRIEELESEYEQQERARRAAAKAAKQKTSADAPDDDEQAT